jgi:hypothetical protein
LAGSIDRFRLVSIGGCVYESITILNESVEHRVQQIVLGVYSLMPSFKKVK